MPRVKSQFDRMIGDRIKIRRMALGMSQSDLGNALGLTFNRFKNTRKAQTG